MPEFLKKATITMRRGVKMKTADQGVTARLDTRVSSPVKDAKAVVLTIYKNHPVGNFRHKHETIKCDVAGDGIAIKHIHIS